MKWSSISRIIGIIEYLQLYKNLNRYQNIGTDNSMICMVNKCTYIFSLEYYEHRYQKHDMKDF